MVRVKKRPKLKKTASAVSENVVKVKKKSKLKMTASVVRENVVMLKKNQKRLLKIKMPNVAQENVVNFPFCWVKKAGYAQVYPTFVFVFLKN